MTPSPLPLLLALADDELLLGYRDSEWTGIAPMLEEDVAMSSVSQDEIGHAQALYVLASDLTGRSVDELAYARSFGEYRSCWLVERHRRDWAFTIARRYLYETADDVRTEALAGSSYGPLASLLQKVRREEKYHLLHVSTWLERLAAAGESRDRLTAALDAAWPDALGFWEPLAEEGELLAAGLLPVGSAGQRSKWLEQVRTTFNGLGLQLPAGEARTGGRRGVRSDEFQPLWREMTEVYRVDPQATW